MRKALFIALAVLAMAADCSKAKTPAPNPSKPATNAQVVVLCVETPFNIRREDHWCGAQKVDDCCVLRYVKNDPAWPVELPAVGEELANGRGFVKPPAGSTPVNIPPEGAIFQR